MWHIALNDTGTGADVFYIVSTWEYDWYTDEGIVSHHADPSKPEHRADMDIEISQVAQYMADGNNFYAPFYRHITLDSWATLNEDTINRRYRDVAFVDVLNAFDYYLTHYNNGRPFILAGFSQGGKSVVELLKTLSEETRTRLVAAYVLVHWDPLRQGSCPGDRKRDRHGRVSSEPGLVLGAVQLDHGVVYPILVGRVHAGDPLRDLRADVLDGLEHSLAAVPVPAVPELVGLPRACGRARGRDRGDPVPFDRDLGLDSGVPPRVEHLPCPYLLDLHQILSFS